MKRLILITLISIQFVLFSSEHLFAQSKNYLYVSGFQRQELNGLGANINFSVRRYTIGVQLIESGIFSVEDFVTVDYDYLSVLAPSIDYRFFYRSRFQPFIGLRSGFRFYEKWNESTYTNDKMTSIFTSSTLGLLTWVGNHFAVRLSYRYDYHLTGIDFGDYAIEFGAVWAPKFINR